MLRPDAVRMEAYEMTKKQQATMMIDIYTVLQRIKNAKDRYKEFNNQLNKQKQS